MKSLATGANINQLAIYQSLIAG
jgi:hypothetical protein